MGKRSLPMPPGIPLFADTEGQSPLKLVDSKIYENGIVQLYYEPKRKS